jgi:hypothetical protein
MPTLEEHQSSEYSKLIYIGDSGTGKTGSLVSLLADGYKFKILDMDNGLDSLVYYAREQCLDKLGNVEFETIRDEYTSGKVGPKIKGSPKAFVAALDKLTEWSGIEDPNTIFVLDSGSAFGRAAFEWAKGMNPTAKDPRQWYFTAQQAFESTIAMLTGEQFRMNVILISHVNYKEVVEGTNKGYVNAIGSALGPTIAKYFNTLILAESSGSGSNVRRRIKTMPTGVIDLKVPTPKVEKELPLETGLSTLFKTLKGTA